MSEFKLFAKSILVGLVRLSHGFKTRAGLPYGKISFSQLPAGSRVVYQQDVPAFTRRPPVTVGPLHAQFKQQLQAPSQKTFVIAGKNWRVWGSSGAIITDENYLLTDVSTEFDRKIHPAFSRFKIAAAAYTSNRVAVLAAAGGNIYYHWMFDVLPRIALLKQSGLFNQINKFAVDFASGKFQAETLTQAGISQSQIIPSGDYWNFHLKAKELIVPSFVSKLNAPSLQACQFLRDIYTSEIAPPAPRQKIYIQRLGGRTVINEDELLGYLNTLNIKTVNPEHLTVAEQVRLFASADLVIGPHGAGFTNIVFCRPDTIVIDLFSHEWINPCYWIIAGHLNLKYGYLHSHKFEKPVSAKAANVLVDINKLKMLMDKLNK